MGPKDPIGKILCEKKKINQEQLGKALDHSAKRGKRLASSLLEMGIAGEEDLIKVLVEQQGTPGIDLAKSIVALKFLDVIPEDVALKSTILPIFVNADQVWLAMADPNDQQIIDEVQFVTGKKVETYVALEARLKTGISEAYALKKRDSSIKFIRGERASFPGNQEKSDGYLAVVTKKLPDPDVSIPEDEELVTIEVRTEDEVEPDIVEAAPIVKKDQADPIDEIDEASPIILIVDDEPDIVRILQKALTSAGFRVASASRGLEALPAK